MSASRAGAIGRVVVVAASYLLSVPVYVAYELILRVLNPVSRPLPPAIRVRVEPVVSDIDLDAVRVVWPARIPTGHAGVTVGHRVHLAREPDPTSIDDLTLVVHELVHVRQRERWGRIAMMQRYGVGWARVLSYRHHPLEIEARTAQAWAREFLAGAADRT